LKRLADDMKRLMISAMMPRDKTLTPPSEGRIPALLIKEEWQQWRGSE
jgi:hypothetical protein